jgi:tetratricopeptide (TPR) repeat protein
VQETAVMGIDEEISNFEVKVNFLYDKFKGDLNHFELLGVAKTAIQKDIEDAYEKFQESFSADKIGRIRQLEVKKKALFIVEKVDHAYRIISDYEKRAEYEKRGYKDAPIEKPREEDAGEKAKSNYQLARSLYAQRAYPMAVSALEEAIRLEPGKAAYHHLLGLCQMKAPGLRHKAEVNLQKAAEIEPWNAEHFAALGMLFYAEKMIRRAESHFRKALQLEPGHALARKKLEEIAPSRDKSLASSLQKGLKKVMPTLFDRKKR